MFYGHLVVTCRVSTSEKPPYWKSMACNLGTFTLLRAGTCSQTVSIGRLEIEPSCSVFRLNYLKRGGRKNLQYIQLFFFVGNYAVERLTNYVFNLMISCIFNQ